MSEKVVPTGSPEDLNFRIESEVTKKVQKIKKSSKDLGIHKELKFNSHKSEDKSSENQEEIQEKEPKKPITDDRKDEGIGNNIDIYA